MEKQIMKECKIHGNCKHLLQGKLRPRYYCSQCSTDAIVERRRRVKQKAVEYKGGKCERCGYDKCTRALEFHHLDPSKKEFALSNSVHCKSWDKVKVELDKCILVCSNCHAEIHEGS